MLYSLLLLVDGVTSRHFCTPTSHMGTVIVLLTNFKCEVKETVSSQEELQRRLLWCWERLSLWTHAHLRTLMHPHMYTRTHTYTCTHILHKHTHRHKHILYTHTHIHMYTYAYQHTQTHMHTCTHVHILHTHTHTHKVYESTSVLPFMNLPTVSLKREDSVYMCL